MSVLKVFIVWHEGYDSSWIEKVFSTLEKAQEFKESHRGGWMYSDLEIEEFEVE